MKTQTKRHGLLVVAVMLTLLACGKTPEALQSAPEGPKASAPAAAPSATPPVNWGEVGNGGHGITVDDKVYLVDLAEAGIEHDPYFGYLDEESRKALVKNFKGLIPFSETEFPVEALLHKLSDIHYQDPLLAWSLVHTMQSFDWKLVNRNLKTLRLQDDIFHFENGTIVLIANRRGRTIYISLPIWRRMDAANQVATLLHEALYALLRPIPVNGSLENAVVSYRQNASRVREINAHLFTPSSTLREWLTPNELPALVGEKDPHEFRGTFFSLSLFDNAVDKPFPAGKYRVTSDATLSLTYSNYLSGGKDHSVEFGYFREPGDEWWNREVGEMCREMLKQTLPVAYINLEDSRKPKTVRYDLEIDNYTEGEEIKSYMKFTVPQKALSVRKSIVFYGKGEAECMEHLTKEGWQTLLKLKRFQIYHPKVSVN